MQVGEISMQQPYRNSAKVESGGSTKGTVWPNAPMPNSFVSNMWIKTSKCMLPYLKFASFFPGMQISLSEEM